MENCFEQALSKFHEKLPQKGILWERKRLYHKLTSGMREIISCLSEQGLYEGECYFMKSQEKMRIHKLIITK